MLHISFKIPAPPPPVSEKFNIVLATFLKTVVIFSCKPGNI